MKTLEEIIKSNHWEIAVPKESDLLYTSDHVINAYLQGKAEALEQNQRLQFAKLQENIAKSAELAGEVIVYAKSVNINPTAAFLKIDSWEDFVLLLTIPETEFLSQNILKVYDFTSSKEAEFNNKLYSIEIVLANMNEHFDNECLVSDGYLLKYSVAK
ncbi:hypothetical protein [Leptospira koniambonensis]|uniref:hypothetical protein n=1 Tax=Leptospira koniambonensis TaxID=2484950 RepID=UPI003EB8A7A4